MIRNFKSKFVYCAEKANNLLSIFPLLHVMPYRDVHTFSL